jgi:hypothetical protein
MTRRLVTPREDNPVVLRASMVKDSAQSFEFLWGPFAENLGTSLSSVAYDTDQGNVTFSANTVTGDKADITVKPTQAGTKLVKMTATMADDSVAIRYMLLNVDDPYLYAGDYADPWRP